MRRKTTNDTSQDTSENTKNASTNTDTFGRLFGFRLSDLSSWDSFVRLMCRPMHPSSLAVFRVCYGVMMFMDCIDERGLSSAIQRWGDVDQCRFPFIHGISPLPVQWMIVVHCLMALGCIGITLGLFFKQSCLLFSVLYWYVFILEKMRWNNHSYLFGLVSIIMLLSDANRCWSLDGLIWPKKRHTHVPLWNYAIPRFQLFILYFVAGLKKFDSDWTHGYSMQLSHHVVFAPLRLIFSNATIDMFFVHTAGHLIDLSLAYLLFFDKTRIIGITFGLMFNLMNATMFSIGMFSYMCVATLPLFCDTDWPMRWFRMLPQRLQCLTPLDEEPQANEHCVYTKEAIDDMRQSQNDDKQTNKDTGDKSGDKKKKTLKHSTENMKTTVTKYHKLCVVLVLCYMSEQAFLPYSHFITQGYNGWTQGLYGYSWDMMIKTWNTQFIKIRVFDKDKNTSMYIAHNAFTTSRNRWSSNADMIKQHASCIQERLAERNISNIEIYMDVWKSMNDRFQQRVIDPRVNILEADWSPFIKSPWLMPLLLDLSDWRGILEDIKNDTREMNFTTVVFVADFPGLNLENFIQEEIGYVNLTVMKGEVIIEVHTDNVTSYNTSLKEGENMSLPIGKFHNVYTVSDTPSCYFYIYEDKGDKLETAEDELAFERMKLDQGVVEDHQLNLTETPDDDNATKRVKRRQKHRLQRDSYLTPIKKFFYEPISKLKRMYKSIRFAIGTFEGVIINTEKYLDEVDSEEYPEMRETIREKRLTPHTDDELLGIMTDNDDIPSGDHSDQSNVGDSQSNNAKSDDQSGKSE